MAVIVKGGVLMEDELIVIPEHINRLRKIDFYNWIVENYSEDFIPHIGVQYNYSLELPERVEAKDIYGTSDVALIFDCGKDKALKILHLMEKYECSTKLGKDYYTTKEHLLKFMNQAMGQKLAI